MDGRVNRHLTDGLSGGKMRRIIYTKAASNWPDLKQLSRRLGAVFTVTVMRDKHIT